MILFNFLLICLLVLTLVFSFGKNRERVKKSLCAVILKSRSGVQKFKSEKGGLKSLLKSNNENSHICSLCHVSNNPLLKNCWHCGHDFDQPVSAEAIAQFENRRKSKIGYHIIQLAKLSAIFNLQSLKIGIQFLPCLIVWMIIDFLISYAPSVKLAGSIINFVIFCFIVGWWLKYYLPKRSSQEIQVKDLPFMAGLKLSLYAIAPALIVAIIFLSLIYLPLSMVYSSLVKVDFMASFFVGSVARIIYSFFQTLISIFISVLSIGATARYFYFDRH